MTKNWQAETRLCRVPNWVPHFAVRYLAHTEKGISIRELERNSQVHASTVLRQIRRIETKRDDPLFDAALSELAVVFSNVPDADLQLEAAEMEPQILDSDTWDEVLTGEMKKILRKLNDPGAVMAFARDMEKAVVVCEKADGSTDRTLVVDRSVAQAMALKDWITCHTPGRISRYQITSEGRAALARMDADDCNNSGPFENSLTEADVETTDMPARKPSKRMRFSTQENPVAVLARRKDKGGSPFLSADLVAASERLREDFEISQIGTAVTQNWDRFLTAGVQSGGAGASGLSQSSAAKKRFSAAMDSLGEGLSEIALRCCCYQEGMVTVEKRMDWPARSGKVVLRIALTRLREHYRAQPSEEHEMIG